MTAQPEVEVRQQEFRKELGLRNLVICQVLNVVGITWVGVAAKLGPSHVIFWLLATGLFYVPSAMVVIYLNRIHTVEGGLYEWTRLGFNEFTGFLVGWNLWLNCLVTVSVSGIGTTAILAYTIGPRAAWIVQDKGVTCAITLLVLGGMAAIAWVGLGIGKWIQDAGGMIMLLVFAALIVLPFRNHLIGRATEYPPFTLSLPALSLFSLNLLGKMGFGAMSGFDSASILAGESRNAERNIRWSVKIATPLIAGMFLLGTNSVVALVPKGSIDLVNPVAQALTAGTQPGDPGAALVPLVMVALLLAYIASQSLALALSVRLPMVAGWDKLLPEWFGKLHPTRKTPSNSILLVVAAALVLGIVAVAGAGQQEAFQLLQSASLGLYALTYMAMFALPLLGRQRNIQRPSLWLKAAAISGLAMTALYLVSSLFPIIDVASPLLFGAKVGGFALTCELVAVGLFYSRRRRKNMVRAAAACGLRTDTC
jgi:amino acid transporter